MYQKSSLSLLSSFPYPWILVILSWALPFPSPFLMGHTMELTHTLHDRVLILFMLYWLLLFFPLSPKGVFIITTFLIYCNLETHPLWRFKLIFSFGSWQPVPLSSAFATKFSCPSAFSLHVLLLCLIFRNWNCLSHCPIATSCFLLTFLIVYSFCSASSSFSWHWRVSVNFPYMQFPSLVLLKSVNILAP